MKMSIQEEKEEKTSLAFSATTSTSTAVVPDRTREMKLIPLPPPPPPPLLLLEKKKKNNQTHHEAGSSSTTTTTKPTTTTTTTTLSSKQQQQPLPKKKLLLHNNNNNNNLAKVGKANLKRDIFIFLGIMGFLLLQAYLWNDVGKPNTDDKKDKKKKTTLKDMQQVLRRQLEESHARELARKRTMECGLFLAPTTGSSIPGAGIGIFAGKRFEVGAEVMHHPGLFLPVFNTRGNNGNNVSIYVSQYGLLLKHHPFLANLQGGGPPTWSEKWDVNHTNVSSSLTALRVIEPGDELFLLFENHPEQVLEGRSDLFRIPSLADYGMVDEIVRQEIISLKPHQTKMASSVTGRPPVPGAARKISTGEALLLTRKAVEIVNKQVAMLLPVSMKELERRSLLDSPSPFSAMNNMTMSNLELNGQCLDDVVVVVVHTNQQTSAEEVRSTQKELLLAQRLIQKGKLVVPAPLYAMKRDPTCCATSDESCATGDNTAYYYLRHCFGHPNSTLVLCPLSAAAFIQTTSSSSGQEGNVAIQWSSRINVKKIHKLSVDELTENYAVSLGMDIVALKDIQPGEEIIIDAVREGGTEDGLILLDEVIYGDMWKFN